tara:strand:+ start:259 stop:510 length:252 start_codon:yes stop_codon:yes gene_type:complete
MRCKIKNGEEHLFMGGFYEKWKTKRNTMIVNFKDKETYLGFKQKKNHLLIDTINGEVDIVFCGEVPKLQFNNYEKDQVVFNCL